MKIFLIAISVFFLNVGHAISQNELEYNESIFIDLSKNIYSIPELRNHLFSYEYKGKKTLFIKSDKRFITNVDKQLKINYGDSIVNFWFSKYLFFEHIEYWLEFTVFEVNDDFAIIKFKTFNCVDTPVKRPRIDGDIKLKKMGNEWKVDKKVISIDD